MQHQPLSSLLILVLAAFFCGGTSLARADDLGSRKIGVITDLTGTAAHFGNQTAVALTLLREDFAHAQSPIRFIIEDTALKTDRAVSAAQRLVSSEDVDALYVDFTSLAVAVAGIVQGSPRPLLYVAAADSVARERPFAFKSFMSYEAACAELVRQFQRCGKTHIALLQAEAEYGELCAKGYRSVATQPLVETYASGDEVDVQVLRLRSRGAEAIINIAYEKDTLAMLRAMRNVNYRVPVGLVESHYSATIKTEFGSFLEGSVTIGVPTPPADFIARAKAAPGGSALGAFDACYQAYQFLSQLAHAALQCPAHERACMIEKTALFPANPAQGFYGYQSRLAAMKLELKHISPSGTPIP